MVRKNCLPTQEWRRKLLSMRYGDYEDDFDADGRGRGVEHRRDVDREDRNGGGHGSERDDDEDEGGLMTMTRRDSERDVRDLYNSSLDDMRRFLREREGGDEDPMKSVTSNAVAGLEIVAGAALAGFLAQRFRQAGAVVPVGLTLAALGLAAAQFNKAGKFSPDLRNISFGALASTVALWAAGRGAISAEGFTFGPPATAGALPGMAAPMSAPMSAPMFASPFAQPPQSMQQPQSLQPLQQPQPMQPPTGRPQPVPTFVAQQAWAAPPMTDFQNLVARGIR